ncbi:hypothetical protein [Bowmanella denitrificans]|uniref:hypothetical protein n=1 Tax=Bowmanella denitrificans TaxID=366582 RepID=UPI000C99E0F8|nr:hypothetical protein [Bowmanella denitrificans]
MLRKAVIALFFVPFMTWAGSNDEGIISTLYVDEWRQVGIKLQGGFPNAEANKECESYNGYAGTDADAPELKAALLAAKASQSIVRVSVSGCASSGSWLKISAVYIE